MNVVCVPTETCKHPKLTLTPEALQEIVPACSPHIVDLYQLWYDINAKRPFHIFDLAPVISADPPNHDMFTWLPVECYWRPKGASGTPLCMREVKATMTSANRPSNLFAASRELSDTSVKRYYAVLNRVLGPSTTAPA